MNINLNPIEADEDVERLRLNKQSGYDYRKRRHEDWRENYTLYRDKVQINRLTQRQSVNIPIMKQSIKTLLKDVDDMPLLQFENRDNDKQAEVFANEYWSLTMDVENMEIKDIVDKKQVFLFGRSFDQMQVVDGKVSIDIQDPQDIVVDRFTDPTNIDTSRFLIHTHIFKPLSYLKNNPLYDQDKVEELEMWHASDQGLLKNATNTDMLAEKNQKMSDLGYQDVENPIFGETIVELSMHFMYEQREGDEEEQIYMYVEADDMKILLNKPLEEVIGTTSDHYWRNHYPYNTWADDVERQDFWSDSVADMIRTPNKILNSYHSQIVENRTLRNYGMHYYDSTIEGFEPQTFEPIPWGWYPVPGKPQDVLQKVEIPDLSESLDEMQFLISVVEKASGATATQQGAQTDKAVTLGEVQLALGEAKQRIKGMSKFYTKVWKQRAEKFLKLVEASGDKIDAVTIEKKGRNTDNIYTREISPKDWQSELGYSVKIWTQDDKESSEAKDIQKLQIAQQQMPANKTLLEIAKRKVLEFSGLTPDEINAILEEEQMVMEQAQMNNQMALQQGQPGQQGQPVAEGQIQPGQPQSIAQMFQQFQQQPGKMNA